MKTAAKPFNLTRSLPAISFLVIATAWCVITYGGLVGPLFVPSPTAVLEKIFSGLKDGSLLMHCWASTRRVMIGWFFSALAALPGGMLMASSAKKITFDGDVADTVGAYMALLIMPLSYSIANGIMFAILSWVIIKVFTGKAKDVEPAVWVVFILFALRIVTLITNFQ